MNGDKEREKMNPETSEAEILVQFTNPLVTKGGTVE